MTPADLDRVMAIADLLHPDLPEPRAVFAERLRLYPPGCLMWGQDGYAIAHPIRSAPPPLARLLGGLPAGPDLLHLHDVALLKTARGAGGVRALLARLAGLAQGAGLGGLSLVAVHGTAPMWRHLGFAPTTVPVPPDYGPDACFMVTRRAPARTLAGPA